jgi:NagD protein
MMRAALRHVGAHSAEACVIGDNLETDIIAGVQTGMSTILVLSGVSKEADLERFAYRPDHIVEDAVALRALLQRLS